MAEEIERYLAKVNFQHTFDNAKGKLDDWGMMFSPVFYARNLPFQLDLQKCNNKGIYLHLFYAGPSIFEFSCSFECHFSVIRPSKPTIQSNELRGTFKEWGPYHIRQYFEGEDLFVNDALTIQLSLLVNEPEGIEFQPPKEKLRQVLQIVENKVQSDEFVCLLNSGDYSDVKFVVNRDSIRVKAHKAILAARSDVFARMLAADMREAKENEIRIDDMGAPALEIMLHHIYTGQLGFPKGIKIDLKICQELVDAGEKYNLQSLKEYAAMAMTEFVSPENGWEVFMFAELRRAEVATKALASYCAKNCREKISDSSSN